MRPTSLLACLALFGCAQYTSVEDADDTEAAVTYYRDVEPILRERCIGCHHDGGLGPFPLTTFDEAEEAAFLVGPAVADGFMPPLPPDQTNCRDLDDPRELTSAERETIARWVDAGAPAGDPDDAIYAPEPQPYGELGPPTDSFDSGLDYLSTYDAEDEYRCFVVDPGFDGWVETVAFDVRSTNEAIVHHAVVFAALPETAAAVDALVAEDEIEGYECFSGARFDGAAALAGDVPGARVLPYPGGTGVPLPPGTRFVVQMHYNFLNNLDANRFTVDMWRPTGRTTGYPHGAVMSNWEFYIPAGDDDVVATGTTEIVPTDEPWERRITAREGLAWDVAGHLHMIGKSIKVELERADGVRECLLDIPSWDFHWQGSYRFATPVELRAGDRVHVECRWDNSIENQPYVDGRIADPRNVTWGEGSRDEMCLAYMLMTDL